MRFGGRKGGLTSESWRKEGRNNEGVLDEGRD